MKRKNSRAGSKMKNLPLGGGTEAGTVGANAKGHALVDDIGNPSVPEQEDYGGAGDLGTTGAVGRPIPRAGKVGLKGVAKKNRKRVGPGDTGERTPARGRHR
jgi:hypothetical protein